MPAGDAVTGRDDRPGRHDVARTVGNVHRTCADGVARGLREWGYGLAVTMTVHDRGPASDPCGKADATLRLPRR